MKSTNARNHLIHQNGKIITSCIKSTLWTFFNHIISILPHRKQMLYVIINMKCPQEISKTNAIQLYIYMYMYIQNQAKISSLYVFE